MKVFIILVLLILVGVGGYYVWKGDLGRIGASSNVEVLSDEVIVNAGDIKASFIDNGSFYGDYMLFGGTYVAHKNAVGPVLLSGLDIEDAKQIYRDYPNFHRCSSPDASLAKPLVQDLNVVPKDSSITGKLKESLREFNRNINMKDGGERVCISIAGNELEMESAKITKDNIDVTNTFKMKHFQLVHNIEMVECASLLASD